VCLPHSSSRYSEFARGYFAKTAVEVYEIYQKELNKIGACDFDDLLMRAVELFEKAPLVRKKYAQRFRYVLVDEYQDVNTAQYVLTKHLASFHGNLTVVGDASQAIYSFRGADFRNILNFEGDFPQARVFNLEQNYRSTQVILDAAYGIINHNKTHPILKLFTTKQGGAKIKLYQARSELDEAQFVVDEINKLVNNHLAYSDFAVLYRTNAQSRVLEEAFLHAGIPYVLVGGVRFYDRREIKDVLCFLRLLANPKDTVSRKRIEKLGKNRFTKFQKFAENFILKEKTTLEILDEVLQSTGYLALYDPKDEEDIARLENIKELRSVATEFPNLTEFLEQVALVETVQGSRGRQQTINHTPVVTLMTAHSAKGLEFTVVFIVGLEEGLLPHSRSLFDAEQLEEERRLAYVGITRAKEILYLTLASRRLIFGQRGSSLPSRFLGEIPEHLLENIQGKTHFTNSVENFAVEQDF